MQTRRPTRVVAPNRRRFAADDERRAVNRSVLFAPRKYDNKRRRDARHPRTPPIHHQARFARPLEASGGARALGRRRRRQHGALWLRLPEAIDAARARKPAIVVAVPMMKPSSLGAS